MGLLRVKTLLQHPCRCILRKQAETAAGRITQRHMSAQLRRPERRTVARAHAMLSISPCSCPLLIALLGRKARGMHPSNAAAARELQSVAKTDD